MEKVLEFAGNWLLEYQSAHNCIEREFMEAFIREKKWVAPLQGSFSLGVPE